MKVAAKIMMMAPSLVGYGMSEEGRGFNFIIVLFRRRLTTTTTTTNGIAVCPQQIIKSMEHFVL